MLVKRDWLPWASISEDCVEDSDYDGDESDELRLAGGDEFVAEAFELRVVTRSDHGADEQRVAHALAASADETLASPLSGLAGPWREPDKGRDLSTVERTEFRQFGNRVRAIVFPTPGTEARRSSFSTQTADPRS